MSLGVGSEISMWPDVPGATLSTLSIMESHSLEPSSIVALATMFYHSDRKKLIHLPHLWE